MSLIEHTRTSVDNTLAQGWDNQGRVITETTVGPLLRDLDLIIWSHVIDNSIRRIKVEDNKMADAAPRLKRFLGRKLLQ